MIVTLTANALAEFTFEVPAWDEGHAARAATPETFQVGGKGINVARVLARLGAGPAEAVVFLGGPTGALCRHWLAAAGCPAAIFTTAAPTRAGAVVRAPGRRETTFLGQDSRLDDAATAAAATWLARRPAGTVLAICGSVPRWDETDLAPLRDAFAAWRAAGRPLVVDSYGPFLAWVAATGADLVKINRRELAGLEPSASDAVAPALAAVAARHPQVGAWVVTDGPGAVWCWQGAGPARGWQPAPVTEVSPTGSGDVVLASLLAAAAWQPGRLAAALPRALELASRKAAQPTTVDFDPALPGDFAPRPLPPPSAAPHP